jgi:hypothetical protein
MCQRAKVLMFTSLLMAVSCKDDPGGPGGGSPWLIQYPLEVGRQWDYNRVIIWDNIRILDSSSYTPLDTVMFSVCVNTTRTLMLPSDTTGSGDSVLVTEFRTVSGEPLSPESFDYYEQSAGALLLHGYIGASVTTPRYASWDLSCSLNGINFSSIHELTDFLLGRRDTEGEITREFPPLTALAYPLIPENSWTYRSEQNPFRLDKVVLSVKDSLIDHRLRRVTIIEWLWDLDRNGIWDDNITMKDYFSSQGLFRRVLDIKDILITGSSGPDPIAIADLKDDLAETASPTP